MRSRLQMTNNTISNDLFDRAPQIAITHLTVAHDNCRSAFPDRRIPLLRGQIAPNAPNESTTEPESFADRDPRYAMALDRYRICDYACHNADYRRFGLHYACRDIGNCQHLTGYGAECPPVGGIRPECAFRERHNACFERGRFRQRSWLVTKLRLEQEECWDEWSR